jgi:hypothetical protein
MRSRFGWPSPATLLSALALFVSLGGVSYAVSKNSIGSGQIKNGSVKSVDIKNGNVLTKDIKNATILGRDIKNGTIASTDIKKSTQDALKGQDGRSALTPLKRGERVYGTYALQGQGPNLWTGVSFPIPAPTPVDSLHVVIANNDTVTGDGCTGTKANPVSAPGFVCIYTHFAVNTTSGYGWGTFCSCGNAVATGDGSRFGFQVQANGNSGTLMTAVGTWVYTAP